MNIKLKKTIQTIAGFDHDVCTNMEKEDSLKLQYTALFVIAHVIIVLISTLLLSYRITLNYYFPIIPVISLALVSLFIAQESNVGQIIDPRKTIKTTPDFDYKILYSWQRIVLFISWCLLNGLLITIFTSEIIYEDEVHSLISDQYLNFIQTDSFNLGKSYNREQFMMNINIILLYKVSFHNHYEVSTIVLLLYTCILALPLLTSRLYPQQLKSYKIALYHYQRAHIQKNYNINIEMINKKIRRFKPDFEFKSIYLDPPFNQTLIDSLEEYPMSQMDLYNDLNLNEDKICEIRDQQSQIYLSQENIKSN